jgi:hypothetical protein
VIRNSNLVSDITFLCCKSNVIEYSGLAGIESEIAAVRATSIAKVAVWSRVQIRIRENQKQTQRLVAAHGPNVSGGRTSKYLLSGLMKCDECGSGYIMVDSRAYQRSASKYGGKHA